MNIQQTVKEEIFPMLGEGKIDEAEKKLRRLMLTLTDKNTTEDHRIVLCSLSRIKYITGDIDSAKYYMGRFKEILEKDDKYIEEYRDRYIDYMNLYAEVYEDDLSIDEQIEINNINLENARIKNDIVRMHTARVNIALLLEDLDQVEDVLMDIHIDIRNYEISKKVQGHKVLTEDLTEKLNNLIIDIYKDIKKKFPNYVQEKFDYAY